jgi:hypothetical protein
VGPFRDHRAVGAGEAIAMGLQRPFRVLAETARALIPQKDPVEVTGPVGIVRAVEKTSRDQAPVAMALGMAGTLVSYFIGVPILVAIILFPRARKARP